MQAIKNKFHGLFATNHPHTSSASCCTGPDGIYRVHADSQGPYKLTLSLSKVPTDGSTRYAGEDKLFYTNNGFESSAFAIARHDLSPQSCQASLFYQSLNGDIYECRIDSKGNCKFLKVDSLLKKGSGIPRANTALAASTIGSFTVVFYLTQDEHIHYAVRHKERWMTPCQLLARMDSRVDNAGLSAINWTDGGDDKLALAFASSPYRFKIYVMSIPRNLSKIPLPQFKEVADWKVPRRVAGPITAARVALDMGFDRKPHPTDRFCVYGQCSDDPSKVFEASADVLSGRVLRTAFSIFSFLRPFSAMNDKSWQPVMRSIGVTYPTRGKDAYVAYSAPGKSISIQTIVDPVQLRKPRESIRDFGSSVPGDNQAAKQALETIIVDHSSENTDDGGSEPAHDSRETLLHVPISSEPPGQEFQDQQPKSEQKLGDLSTSGTHQTSESGESAIQPAPDGEDSSPVSAPVCPPGTKNLIPRGALTSGENKSPANTTEHESKPDSNGIRSSTSELNEPVPKSAPYSSPSGTVANERPPLRRGQPLDDHVGGIKPSSRPPIRRRESDSSSSLCSDNSDLTTPLTSVATTPETEHAPAVAAAGSEQLAQHLSSSPKTLSECSSETNISGSAEDNDTVVRQPGLPTASSSPSNPGGQYSAGRDLRESEFSGHDLRQRLGAEELFLVLKSSGCANLTSRGVIEPLQPVLDYGEIDWPNDISVRSKRTYRDVITGVKGTLPGKNSQKPILHVQVDPMGWINEGPIRTALTSPITSPRNDLLALKFELTHGHPFGLDDLLVDSAKGLIEINELEANYIIKKLRKSSASTPDSYTKNAQAKLLSRFLAHFKN